MVIYNVMVMITNGLYFYLTETNFDHHCHWNLHTNYGNFMKYFDKVHRELRNGVIH
jgi:hypothetical protein